MKREVYDSTIVKVIKNIERWIKNLSMKHLNTKKLVLCLALASAMSNTSFADTIAVDSSLNTQTKNQAEKHSPVKSSVVSCPSDFQQVKIAEDARQCQAFDKNMTAVMVYHSPRSPNEILNVYQTAHPSLKAHAPISGRTLLSSNDKAVRVIISPDKAGSQVDILVTSTNK